jgi:amino acid adenylation domain-containing protein
LAGAPPVLELPLDRPRPAVRSGRGASRPLRLAGEVCALVRQQARRQGATPFMTLLAAWQAVLSRWSGQEDVSVGTPVWGRQRAELENLIGFFVNTLVVRTDLSGEPRFGAAGGFTLAGNARSPGRSLVSRVREDWLSACEHQQVPFEKVVEALDPQRSLAHTPLFQVMFALQDAVAGDLVLPGLETALLPPAAAAGVVGAKFDLTLSLVDTGEAGAGLAGTLEYDPELFDGATVARLAGWFESLLRAAAGSPEARVAELPLLAAAERFQAAVEWNDTGSTGEPELLHAAFERQARRRPEAVAVVCGEQALTYGEVDARANHLAAHLRGLGVGPEVLVGICLERSAATVTALLAVLKAGGAYVPLDPGYPAARRAFLAADAGVSVVVTREALLPLLPGGRFAFVCLEQEAAWQDLPAERTGLPGHLAYLIYTSGSTGRPKGVAIEHRSACALVRWAATVFPAADLSAVLASTSLNFDLSIFELFVPLSLGGRVVVVEDGLALPRQAGVTLLNTVPAALAEVLRQGPLPASVKTVNLAGEPLRRRLAEQAYESGAGVVYNLYGPSEDTTYSTWERVAAGGASAPSIGRPVCGTRVHLVDRRGGLAARGAVGELCLAGEGLARGYWGRPELTAERFVPDPFGGRGERLYRTGDLARHLPDGRLDLLGRMDQQVKVRGFRIELEEVERALELHPGLRESAVALAAAPAREETGERVLAAYVVFAGEAVAPGELQRFLARSLPVPMVPALFVALPALPRTPNGKVDRRALPAPDGCLPAGREGSPAPRTPVEELIAAVWMDLLRVERVGAGDDFFALGGHSLLATRVVSRLRETFGVELPLRALFAAPTLAELAASVERARRGGAAADAAGAHALPRIVATEWAARNGQPALRPVSFAQERLWLIDQLEPAGAAYNVPLIVRLAGPLAVAALALALTEIVRRHEVLRTSFASGADGELGQWVAEPAPQPLPLVDLRALGGAAQREAAALAARASERPFDLARGPLLRTALTRLGAEEHILLVTVHHIAFDGWSLGVLTRELGILYETFLRRAPSPLPELPVQYADFARWQRSWLESAALAEHLAFWKRHLDGAPQMLALPTDYPRPAVQSYRGERQIFELPAALAAALPVVSRSLGATLFMTFFAALNVLFYRCTGQEDIVLGAPVANRNRFETEGMIGFFVNVLPLRTRLAGELSFRQLLERVREEVLEAAAHQDLPSEKLMEELRPERRAGRSPLYQVVFTMQNAPLEVRAFAGLTPTPLEVHNGTAKFDLTFNVWQTAAGIGGSIEHNADLFAAATVRLLWQRLERLLGGVAADPDAALDDLEIFTEQERLLFSAKVEIEGLEAGFLI